MQQPHAAHCEQCILFARQLAGFRVDLQIKPDAAHSAEVKRLVQKYHLEQAFQKRTHPEEIQLAIEAIESQLHFSKSEADSQYIYEEIHRAVECMKTGNIKNQDPGSLREALGFSEKTLRQFNDMGITYFGRKDFGSAKAIFSLLTLLEPMVAGFWMRRGLASQECKEFEEATTFFAVATMINPDDPLPRLLAASCHFTINDYNSAEEEMASAKRIMESIKEPSPQCKSMLDQMQANLDRIKQGAQSGSNKS